MLTNYHTHTVFCDGNDTPEQMVLAAISRGFSTLGFSGHGYTDFDGSFCMSDTASYIAEISRLKEKYKDKIEILLGVEEDMFELVWREDFSFLIGSAHYSFKDGKYYSVDESAEATKECLAAWGGDALAFAEDYYARFCNYIEKRRPDIIGHFDLITKFDDILENPISETVGYFDIAEKYLRRAAKTGCPFELNTGAVCRGYRKNPYPDERLLRVLREENAKIILSSDCHAAEKLSFGFAEAKATLKDIGFTEIYHIKEGALISEAL